jgi:hypothetical protein
LSLAARLKTTGLRVKQVQVDPDLGEVFGLLIRFDYPQDPMEGDIPHWRRVRPTFAGEAD